MSSINQSRVVGPDGVAVNTFFAGKFTVKGEETTRYFDEFLYQ